MATYQSIDVEATTICAPVKSAPSSCSRATISLTKIVALVTGCLALAVMAAHSANTSSSHVEPMYSAVLSQPATNMKASAFLQGSVGAERLRQPRRAAAVVAHPGFVVEDSSRGPKEVEATTSRREMVMGAFAAYMAKPPSAFALFGFGENKDEKYNKMTTEVIEQVRYTLEVPLNDDNKAASIEKTRRLTNEWVARYRRDKAIIGRPSYGQVYSALNAVSGHYNNFGTKYPLPQKRKDRVLEEFKTAEIALSRGR